MRINFLLVAIILCIEIILNDGLNNGIALTPPMGWMHWERFRCNIDCENYPDDCISERLFKRMADLLVTEGYADLGYKYLIVDDCWLSKKRDKFGRLQADPIRFPNGIKELSNYIHSKGLLFGLYEDYGTLTCAGYPGVVGHMKEDALQFINWGVDYVKLDGCYADPKSMDKGYTEFGQYLNDSGIPVVYSCSWPAYQDDPNYTLIAQHCNLWRNYDDIQDSYESLKDIISHFGDMQDLYSENAGPGHWNDPDMLIIGNFGLSYEQSKLQMAIWAILAAPLIMSNDLGNIKAEFKEILQNKDIIKINQDKLGIPGKRIFKNYQYKYHPVLGVPVCWNQMTSVGAMRCQKMGGPNIEVWTRQITPVKGTYYSYVIAFVSYRTDGTPFAFSAKLQDLGLIHPNGYSIKDLYSDEPPFLIKGENSTLNVLINPTGVVFFRAELT